MIQIYQESPRYGYTYGWPNYQEFSTPNLLPKEETQLLGKMCCLRVKIEQPDRNRKQYLFKFTRNNALRTWLHGEMHFEDFCEETFEALKEYIVGNVLSQIGKTEDDDVIVLVDVS